MVYDAERARLQRMLRHEKRLRTAGYFRIAGVDEAGRGPLAGPVVAAACILPPKTYFQGLNDSKQVSPDARKRLFEELTSHPEVKFGIGICDVETIDKMNIFQASLLAMQQAVEALPNVPDFLLIDGNHLPKFAIPAEAIVEGDAESASIAAASILAKVTRDKIMIGLHEKWPQYNFAKHKGYGTEEHQAALQKWGPSPVHRRSFETIREFQQLKMVTT